MIRPLSSTIFLRDSKAELVWVEKGTKVPNLNSLWSICNNKKNLKGIELMPSLSYSEYLKIDREVPPISEDILIFGGSAATYELPSISADIIAKGHPRTSEGMAVILYSGEDLHFTFDYVLGWQALGKEITVTGTLDKRIKMMDDVTPGEIYNKYLGTGLSIRETNVFPLIVYEDGIEYIRMPKEIHNDGSMTMFVDIPEGTKARLSYGDKNTILDDIHTKVMRIADFRPEGIRAYSCAARRVFWGDEDVGIETKYLNKVAPVCGFYSSGEIIRFGKTIRICNQTLSIVSIYEFNGRENNSIEFDVKSNDTSMVSRLAYFTRKVSQEQEEALQMAEAANKAKTEFLFNMSHDIRTPLNAIMGFTNIADRDIKNGKKATEAIGKVRNSTEILLSIINDILDMSRVESGKAKVSYDNIDLEVLLDRLAAMMRTLATSKNIRLHFDTVNLKNKYVCTDKNILQRVLINIVSNAVKYTNDNGSVYITLEQGESNSETGRYKFIVRDTGIGMSEEFQKHMFEEFSREDNSTVSGIQGTGLGLALAHKLVVLMGGPISCVSKKNVGSTFTIEVPLEIVSSAQNVKQDVDESVKYADFTDMKVLLVEDNDLNREIGRDILEQIGFYVDDAVNGQIAVDILKDKGPRYYDYILMDIQMPVMNGYDATRAIRQMYPNDNIVIIAVSANAFNEDRIASREAGMNEHIAKPINLGELKTAMAKYL